MGVYEAILVLVSVFAVYLPALKYHYVCDDLSVKDDTMKNKVPKPKGIKYIWALITGSGYWDVPVKDKDGKVIEGIERNPHAHLVPIIMHFITSLLIYFVFGKNQISFIAALLFAIHPINTEVSTWMGAKSYGRTTILVLIAWGLASIGGSTLFIWAPKWIMFVNAMFSPVMFIFHPGIELWQGIAIAVICTGFMLYRYLDIWDKTKSGKLAAYQYNEIALEINFYKIIIAFKFYGYYLYNSIFGMHYSFYQEYMEDFLDTKEGIKKGRQIDIFFWVGVFAAYVLILNLVFFYDRASPNMFIFGLLWATVHFAMWSNFVNTGQQYASNRQTYLANVGICLMIASVCEQFPGLALGFSGWYLRQTMYAIRQYRNTYWHFLYNIVDLPDFHYAWLNHGNMMFHRGHFTAAIADFIQANDLSPNRFKTLYNMSSAWLAKGDLKQAIEWFEKARKADVYAQEAVAQDLIVKRMALINRMVKAQLHHERLLLTTTDIGVVS